MMHPGGLKIENFTYELPEEKIATFPMEQRDESKLLVYQRGAINTAVYKNIADYLPTGSLMVFNQTKVVHARINFYKETGSKIEIFCLEPDARYKDIQTAMTTRSEVYWKCMVGGAGKWKAGVALQLHSPEGGFTLSASVAYKSPDSFTIHFSWDRTEMSFAEVLHFAGKVPLPPYIKRSAAAVDEDSYQTIYAKEEGSVAAPTAGLHFTPGIMQSFTSKNIDTAFVTLHVGAGTFKPVKAATMDEHEMHAEWIDVPVETIEKIKDSLSHPIIAVGTTSLRTLESLYWIGAQIYNGKTPALDGIAVNQWDPYEQDEAISAQDALTAIISFLQRNGLTRLVTRTRVIIAPGYSFRIIKGLVTNFHQPQSTLLLLVAALIGEDWKKVYQYALSNEFRFLSYGDGSLLLP